jgi:MbtH protein
MEIVMNSNDREDRTIYRVAVNQEEQYSIWLASRENPLGWRNAGSVTKSECLPYIKEVWSDMRPLSLHTKIAESVREA